MAAVKEKLFAAKSLALEDKYNMETTIHICKNYINMNNLEELKMYVHTLFEYNYDWPTLFQKIYLHACLKKNKEIATWLQTEVYTIMDPIQQIALRQVFPYGKYLLEKYRA